MSESDFITFFDSGLERWRTTDLLQHHACCKKLNQATHQQPNCWSKVKLEELYRFKRELNWLFSLMYDVGMCEWDSRDVLCGEGDAVTLCSALVPVPGQDVVCVYSHHGQVVWCSHPCSSWNKTRGKPHDDTFHINIYSLNILSVLSYRTRKSSIFWHLRSHLLYLGWTKWKGMSSLEN